MESLGLSHFQRRPSALQPSTMFTCAQAVRLCQIIDSTTHEEPSPSCLGGPQHCQLQHNAPQTFLVIPVLWETLAGQVGV